MSINIKQDFNLIRFLIPISKINLGNKSKWSKKVINTILVDFHRNLTKDENLVDLVKVCIKWTFFFAMNQCHEQIKGVDMGSLSPSVLTNIYIKTRVFDNTITTWFHG